MTSDVMDELIERADLDDRPRMRDPRRGPLARAHDAGGWVLRLAIADPGAGLAWAIEAHDAT